VVIFFVDCFLERCGSSATRVDEVEKIIVIAMSFSSFCIRNNPERCQFVCGLIHEQYHRKKCLQIESVNTYIFGGYFFQVFVH